MSFNYEFAEDEEKMRFYREMANHGYLTPMKKLAYVLRYVKKSPQNLNESFKWYLKAASLDDPESILAVGDMLRDGHGTEQNPVRAIEYYKKVANNSHAHKVDRKAAASRLAYTYENFLEDGKNAIKWLKKSFRLGNTDARLKIAEIYRDGKGIKADGEKAIEWFTKILDDQSLSNFERYFPALEIAKMFRKGISVPRSDEKSIKYLKLAANAGIPIARIAFDELVKIYCTSEEITPNIETTIYWLKNAAGVGSRKAVFTIAEILRDGKFDFNQNGEKVLEFLEATVNNLDTMSKVSAMRIIAEIYGKGEAVPQNKEKSEELSIEASSIMERWTYALNNLQSLA